MRGGRAHKRTYDLRLRQIWVPDTRSLKFATKVRRQCAALKGDRAEAAVAHLGEEAASLIVGWE